MNCMKCGKETKNNRVFCEECLAVMDAYPVKPGTPVKLPHRSQAPKKAVPRKKVLSPEEQLPRLRKAMAWMGLTILALALALGLTVSMLLNTLNAQEAQDNLGKNYSTTDSNDAT